MSSGRKRESGTGGIGRVGMVEEEVGRGLEGGGVDIELTTNIGTDLVRSVESVAGFTIGMDDSIFKIPAS